MKPTGMSAGFRRLVRCWSSLSTAQNISCRSPKHLLQAQVILSDRQDRSEQLLGKLLEHLETTGSNLSTLTVNVSALASRVQELAEGQRHTDERLNALIAVVDELVRRGGTPGHAAPPQ
jgi:hypothetical protein